MLSAMMVTAQSRGCVIDICQDEWQVSCWSGTAQMCPALQIGGQVRYQRLPFFRRTQEQGIFIRSIRSVNWQIYNQSSQLQMIRQFISHIEVMFSYNKGKTEYQSKNTTDFLFLRYGKKQLQTNMNFCLISSCEMPSSFSLKSGVI